jgi:hypothetical protein
VQKVIIRIEEEIAQSEKWKITKQLMRKMQLFQPINKNQQLLESANSHANVALITSRVFLAAMYWPIKEIKMKNFQSSPFQKVGRLGYFVMGIPKK